MVKKKADKILSMNKEEKKEMIRNYLNKKGFTTQPSGSSDDGEVA